MCLVTIPNARKQIANKDIIVYKVIDKIENNIVISFSEYFKYSWNKLYIAILTPKIKELGSFVYWDNTVEQWIRNSKLTIFLTVDEGFHSMKTLDRMPYTRGHLVVKCTIPKGSEYYKDQTGLIVSNQIVINEVIQ